MKVVSAGHVYELDERGGGTTLIHFVNSEPGTEQPGLTTQEILRMLIDRTRYCNKCLPHPNNERIIYHFRMALVLHEARALERKVVKEQLAPEFIVTGDDGHFSLTGRDSVGAEETIDLVPFRIEHEAGRPHYSKQHSVQDAPGTYEVQGADTVKRYFKEGMLHREDGPAVIFKDGTQHWYKHGMLHRDGGPAVEYKNGRRTWYTEGKYVRTLDAGEMTQEEMNKLAAEEVGG